MTRTIALRIAYDGAGFSGSQFQANARSVQGELESAWQRFCGEDQRFTLAGRTDAGVHAEGQVAHIRSATQQPTETIRRAMQALTTDDLSIMQVAEMSGQFHARYSAIWRHYRYLIDPNPVPHPFFRRIALQEGQELDITAMQAALNCLLGEHDFAAFGAKDESVRTTVRRCEQAQVSTVMVLGRTLIAIELRANAFLRHMVRTIIGTLLPIGRGQLPPDSMQAVLDGNDRRRAGPTAPPQGLWLLQVGYPPEYALINGS